MKSETANERNQMKATAKDINNGIKRAIYSNLFGRAENDIPYAFTNKSEAARMAKLIKGLGCWVVVIRVGNENCWHIENENCEYLTMYGAGKIMDFMLSITRIY